LWSFAAANSCVYESIAFYHRDTPSGELAGRQHVPAAGTDDHQVVAVRRHH
jgi:hypothetical protein